MLSSSPSPTSKLLLMASEDNCLIARADVYRGEVVTIDGQHVIVPQNVALGHKVARRNLLPGAKVVRYGALIGSVTQPIGIGGHIHTHNLASDYIQTFTLDADGRHFLDKESP